MNTTLRGALTVSALVTSLCAQGALSAPCLVTQLGTNLNMFDDSVAPNNALGFSFPMPGGGSITSIDISSNGFVWLGSDPNSACCNGNEIDFLAGLPRIAPFWGDLNPSASGGVWFNTFPASSSSPASAVVTWDGVPEYGQTAPMTIQLQMFDDGSFLFAYDGRCYNLGHDVLIGVTQGNGATANPIDFSAITASNPYVGATNPTVHDVQSLAFDVSGRSFAFTPLGVGGYLIIDRPQCTFGSSRTFGLGCPVPATGYEHFVWPALIDLSNTAVEFTPLAGGGYVGVPTTGFFTGYTTSTVFSDDEVQGPFNLPFTFTYPGGSTNAIDISSNGFIWLQSGNPNPRCCDGDPLTFMADPASICAIWMDLYPPGGGGIYFDVVGNEAHITWAGVPEYSSGPPQTAQITLRSDGSFRLAWQSVSNSSHSPLVGFTEGNTPIDPGSSDFSVGPVLIGGGGIPLALTAQSGSTPAIGQTFTMEVNDIAPNSLLGLMVFGLQSFVPGLSLGALGADGCSLYASLDMLLTFPLAGAPTPYALSVPNSPALVAVVFYAQAATLTPGINPFGFATSNGLEITFGN